MLPLQRLCAPAWVLETGLTGRKNTRAEDACDTVVSMVVVWRHCWEAAGPGHGG
jgi:hypothetical protein